MYDDLTLKQKAELIKLGVSNGIYSLKDIKDIYNKFEDGGYKSNRDKALKRTNNVASNYQDSVDRTISRPMLAIRQGLRYLKDCVWDKIPAGISNCTLSATSWVDPNRPYMRAASIVEKQNNDFNKIDEKDAIPGDLLITRNPNTGSYHTMMITGFDQNNKPIVTYSTGGNNNSFLRTKSLQQYHLDDNDQNGNHTQEFYYRPNYKDEVTLPEITIIANKK